MELNGRPFFKGSATPANLYLGYDKTAGWKEISATESNILFNNSYNDRLGLVALGRSKQPVNYYREASGSGILPVEQHSKSYLDKARIDTIGQQTPMYYREYTGEGIKSFSDNNEDHARYARVETLAKQTVCVKGTNLVTNGDFSSALSGWLASGGANTLDSGKLRFVSSGSFAYAQPYYNIVFAGEHKYYIAFQYQVDSSVTSLALRWLYNNGNSGSTYIAALARPTSITRYSIVSTLPSGTYTSVGINWLQYSPADVGIWLDNLIVIDLTAEFGAGSEPTAAQVDAMLAQYTNSWFDGTNILTTDTTTYTANSPSIKYPAAITPAVAAGRSVGVYRRRKNFLNLENVFSFPNCIYNNGVITANIQNSYMCVLKITNWNAWLLKNKGRTFTFSCIGGSSDTRCSIVVYGTRTEGGILQEEPGVVGVQNVSITLATDFTAISYIELRFNRKASAWTDTTTIFSNFQFELGATVTPYEPYSGTDYSGSFANEAYGLPSAPDSLDLVTGKEKHGTAFVLFDGSADESWSEYSAYSVNGLLCVKISVSNLINDAAQNISTHFKIGSVGSSATTPRFEIFNNELWVQIPNTVVADVAAFKVWLVSANFGILCKLTTPTIVSHTAQALALTSTLNNVFSDIGTLFLAYQVKTGYNITGDILSPTPDYPAPISPAVAAGGSAKVYQRKKNLYPFTINYLKTNNDNSISTNYYSVTLKVPANTAYTVQVNVATAEPYGWLYMLGATGAFVSITSTGIKNVTVNSRANGTISVGLSIQAWGDGTSGSGGDISYVSNLQLELGSTATPYEPYSGADYALTPQAAMYGLTGAPDSIGADGTEVHGTKKLTLNGTEAWTLVNSGSIDWYYMLSLPDAIYKASSTIMTVCSHYKWGNIWNTTTNIGCGLVWSSFRVRYGTQDTVDNWKAYLAAQYAAGSPVTIVYCLATPVTYSNAAQQIVLSDGLNNIFSDVGTLNIGYQVPDGANIAGDIASPTPEYSAPIIVSAGSVRAQDQTGARYADMEIPELRGIPDGAGGWIARDSEEIRKVGTEWHRILIQKVYHKIFNGTESIYAYVLDGFIYFTWTLPNPAGALTSGVTYHMTCTHFIARYYSHIPTCYIANNGYTMFFFPNRTVSNEWISTVGLLKSWFASEFSKGTPITVDYPLATPIETDLGAVNLPSYYPNTRVIVTGDYPPDVTATLKVVDTM